MKVPLLSIVVFNVVSTTFLFVVWKVYTEPWISIVFTKSAMELKRLSLRARSQAMTPIGMLVLANCDLFGLLEIEVNQHLFVLPVISSVIFYCWRRKVEGVADTTQ
jgi:hypothetical protein